MQPQPQQQDVATLTYRVNVIEKDVQHLQTQLQTYVPVRENDLQLQSIRSTVERIETDVKETKKAVTEQKESQDKLIIKVLWGIVATVLSVVTAVLIYFLTHPGG